MVFYFKGCKQIFFCFIKSNEYLIHMTEVSRYGLCGLGHQSPVEIDCRQPIRLLTVAHSRKQK
jgi:hypothetical protein